MKCGPITNSLCVSTLFERIGHNTVRNPMKFIQEEIKNALRLESTLSLHNVSAELPIPRDRHLRRYTLANLEPAFARLTGKGLIYRICRMNESIY